MVQSNDMFGNLLVVSESFTMGRYRKVKVLCKCGALKIVHVSNLKTGNTKSCGCLKAASGRRARVRNSTQGQATTRLYKTWASMHRRHLDPGYQHDPKKFIVCDEWYAFEVFQIWAQRAGYKDDLTLDRIDNHKGYCPENCRFTTSLVQAQNRGKSSRNTSGYIGVSPSRGKWRANASHSGRAVDLGRHDDPIEAARVRDDYVRKHYESPTLNFPTRKPL